MRHDVSKLRIEGNANPGYSNRFLKHTNRHE